VHPVENVDFAAQPVGESEGHDAVAYDDDLGDVGC
jgi:hypothetical protein